MNGKCNQKDIVYMATTSDPERKYIGSTQNFKRRWHSHCQSFKKEELSNSTALSKFIWENEKNPEPNIKWEVIAKAKSYSAGSKDCNLCLTEKVYILKNSRDQRCLNKRSELAQKCRHKIGKTLQHVRPEGIG